MPMGRMVRQSLECSLPWVGWVPPLQARPGGRWGLLDELSLGFLEPRLEVCSAVCGH